LFEQSTKKCKWESYDGQAKFLDTIKAEQVIGRNLGCGPQLVDLFIKQHIKKIHAFARQCDFRSPTGVRWDKSRLATQRKAEVERARKEAREETRVQMQVLNDHVVALCATKCLKAFLFSLPDFNCNIIALLTGCILYMKGLDAARTMPQRWPVQGMKKRS